MRRRLHRTCRQISERHCFGNIRRGYRRRTHSVCFQRGETWCIGRRWTANLSQRICNGYKEELRVPPQTKGRGISYKWIVDNHLNCIFRENVS